jgi:hypothetical protein
MDDNMTGPKARRERGTPRSRPNGSMRAEYFSRARLPWDVTDS